VVPYYNMLSNHTAKVICVVLRYGEGCLPAKICDENQTENEDEVINSQSICYSGIKSRQALVLNLLTLTAIEQIFSAIGESVGPLDPLLDQKK